MTTFQHLFDVNQFPPLDVPSDADREQLLRLLREHDVRFLRLQFCDLFGRIKKIEVPASQFARALDGGITFDGSAIAGFVRVEEPDLVLRPDFPTLRMLPWGDVGYRVARVICDIHRANGSPFDGDPRGALRRVLRSLSDQGFELRVGMEVEFLLLRQITDERPRVVPHDTGGYLDFAPADQAEIVRRDIVNVLEHMSFAVEAAHHDPAPGQHEIVFRHSDPLATADNVATFRLVVHTVAARHGLRATFMPKPVTGEHGSGMHTHQSLFRGGENVFHDPEEKDELSELMRFYAGGLLKHARGYCAVTNPLVNSYKRLVRGYEAPVNVAWAIQNRSPMIRVLAGDAESTRLELRMPDPAANPYLAVAVQIAAGLDGIENQLVPGELTNKNIWAMGQRERQRVGIGELPRDLGQALDELEKDRVVRSALGEHIYAHFMEAKRAEWDEFLAEVHAWEIERYLGL
ncbi:type I glutamate--ammonia ligase [soil metagenome]